MQFQPRLCSRWNTVHFGRPHQFASREKHVPRNANCIVLLLHKQHSCIINPTHFQHAFLLSKWLIMLILIVKNSSSKSTMAKRLTGAGIGICENQSNIPPDFFPDHHVEKPYREKTMPNIYSLFFHKRLRRFFH